MSLKKVHFVLTLLCMYQDGISGNDNSGAIRKEDSLKRDSYDFIVVGGGTSGCVVASRLSEKYNVLLLEAGGDPGDKLDIPATTLSSIMDTEFTKVYASVPQANAGLSNNGTFNFIIGKTLGGGSAVNGMIYNRGSPYDYDNWANVTGDTSWSYNNLLNYFKRIEDYNGKFYSEEHHGKGGPISISSSNYAPGLSAWLKAGEFLGYEISDPNGPQKISFTRTEFSQRKGKRVSSYQGYIKPFLESRPQLKVLQHSQVSKILFEDKKAVGVQFTNSKSQDALEVFAKKEIILSAGTMDSSAILLRSGIGPKDALELSKIAPKKILPVGRNLQNHFLLKLDFTIVANDTSDVFIPERDLTPENLKIFEETGDGPYASLNGLHGQAFLVTSKRKAIGQSKWADFELFLAQSTAMLSVLPETSKDSTIQNERIGISVLIEMVRPKSIGTVSLDLNGTPLIDFKYLSHPDDIEVLIEAINMTLKIMEETPSFQKLDARYSTKPFDKCINFPFRSDAYWRCFISYQGGSGYHAGGTCRMGKGKEDLAAVVDSNLKVIGIQGLRVVDLSIMPNVTNSNTQAAAYVIAEKASDQILFEWQGPEDNILRAKQEL